MFSLLKLRTYCGLVQMAEVQSGSVTEDLRIERRFPVGEGDGEPQLGRIEAARRFNIGDEKLRFGGKKCRFGCSVGMYIAHRPDSFEERLPVVESCLLR